MGAAAQDAQHPGQPHNWGINLQEALSPVERSIHWFSTYTLFFIIPITILVAVLLAWVAFRYNERRNPVASRTSHNTLIEVIWTVAPVLILLCLAIPSFQLLTEQYNPPRDPELTIKATGYQWYWGYEYQPGVVATSAPAPAADAAAAPATPVSFESYMMQETDRPGSGKEDMSQYPRLLTVDNELVVPVDTVIRVLATSGDVIHSFALPSMGVKVDAVPGRNNEYWFEALKEGIFYGQCSELCGRDHAYMPISLRVVSKEQFATWLAAAASDVGEANKALTASIQSAGTVSVAGR
ncbi:MAG: cytochrome c oxidase subunit II [Oxalobacteraceae bacterium]|nr:MAG: cytochrome c oxidase subunit II [Oxalobacteraceae bacterium]